MLAVLLDGLARLEYRGYDSAGVALVGAPEGGIWRARAANGTRSLDDLTKRAESAPQGATAGIGHTRWATHGRPSEQNAHPLLDCSGRLALVHNGIIENHVELADELGRAGHRLESETDTEVLAHLVEDRLAADPGAGLAGALRAALAEVRGAFSVAVVHADEPGLIVAARRVSPLLMGVSDGCGLPRLGRPGDPRSHPRVLRARGRPGRRAPAGIPRRHRARRHAGRAGAAHRRLGHRCRTE